MQHQFSVRFLLYKINCAADFLSRSINEDDEDTADENHNEEIVAAIAASVVVALDLSDSLTQDPFLIYTKWEFSWEFMG